MTADRPGAHDGQPTSRVIIEPRQQLADPSDSWTSKLMIRRILATGIDWFLGLLIAVFIGWLGGIIGVWSDVDGSRGTVIDQALLLVCVIGLSVGLQSRLSRWGQSVGKQVTGIEVSGTDDMSIFAVRELIKYLPLSIVILQAALAPLLIIYVVSYVMAWRTPGSSVHDRLVNTSVVRHQAIQES